MAQSMAALGLPTPPSWYPGHMKTFVRMLPALLSRTDVVLELRDARLPLTSVNSAFEGERLSNEVLGRPCLRCSFALVRKQSSALIGGRGA